MSDTQNRMIDEGLECVMTAEGNWLYMYLQQQLSVGRSRNLCVYMCVCVFCMVTK